MYVAAQSCVGRGNRRKIIKEIEVKRSVDEILLKKIKHLHLHYHQKTADMKGSFYLSTLLLLIFCTTIVQAQQWQTAAITGYGKVMKYPDASVQPNAKKIHIIALNSGSAIPLTVSNKEYRKK